MSSRSSIFSFNTVKGFPPLKVVILTIIFLAVMMAIGKAAFFNRDNRLYLLYWLDEHLNLFSPNIEQSDFPEIVVAGDSRIFFGIKIDNLEYLLQKTLQTQH